MLKVQDARALFVCLPDGETAGLSAASGMVKHGQALYLIADDQSYLARFDSARDAPGETFPLLSERWPEEPEARKARKADFEALAAFAPTRGFPYGALLAIGSGSSSQRERGVLLALDAGGRPEAPCPIDLSELFDALRLQLPALNIEGAFVCAEFFVVLHRGNKSDPRNAAIRFPLAEVYAVLTGERNFFSLAHEIEFYDLGAVEGIPLSFTDGCAVDEGHFIFSAVAEDSADSYNDGRCVGASVGIADLRGKVLLIEALEGAPKVEGIAIDEGRLVLVTDADAPDVPALLLRVDLF